MEMSGNDGAIVAASFVLPVGGLDSLDSPGALPHAASEKVINQGVIHRNRLIVMSFHTPDEQSRIDVEIRLVAFNRRSHFRE
jgi:hypothetical protein